MNSNGPCKSGFFLVSKCVLYKTKEAMSCSRDLDGRGLIVTAEDNDDDDDDYDGDSALLLRLLNPTRPQ